MQQYFLLRNLTRHCRRGHHQHCRCRTFHEDAVAVTPSIPASSIKWVRDRALDHGVEKERDLKTVLNLKNLIKSEPSKSLPLSIISQHKGSLGIPIRPIDFLRKYPSVFEEFFPGGVGIHPHVKLTPEILTLDAEEQLTFQSDVYRQEVADRLLKLLMIARVNKIPLCIINRLKWDLGLPDDYIQSLVPQFPDYFEVTDSGNDLELVCWSDELAVSVMEKKSTSSFPLQYSRGFELDKKYKKWVDDWQKLPYFSPYTNSLHLQAKSDESDRWAVALLHELLHLLVPKKTEKDNLLFLGEYLGIRSRFKRALLQHPGIFYISSKLGVHTVVLREAYKRDLLVEKPRHPLMALRFKYIHLMNMVKEENKSKNLQVDGAGKQRAIKDSKEGEVEEGKGNESQEEEDGTLSSVSDSEFEGVTGDDSNSDEMEGSNTLSNRGRPSKKMKFEGTNNPPKHLRSMSRKGQRNRNIDHYSGNEDYENRDTNSRGKTTRTTRFTHTEDSVRRNSSNSRKGDDYHNTNSVSNGSGIAKGRTTRKATFDEKANSRINQRSDRRRGMKEENPTVFLSTELKGARNTSGRSVGRSGASRSMKGQS